MAINCYFCIFLHSRIDGGVDFETILIHIVWVTSIGIYVEDNHQEGGNVEREFMAHPLYLKMAAVKGCA
jgi:hypothetical protein